MTETHTPGPWVAREYLSPPNTWFVRGPEDENVTGQAGGKMNEANARLIAAAPDMLEALVAAERQLRPLSGRSRHADLHKIICAAIDKATAASSVGKSGTDLNQTTDPKDSFFSVAVEVCL